MHILTALMYILFVWRWADWRNWEKYYPTLIYVAMSNLLYDFLCTNYLLWKWIPNWIDKSTSVELFYVFITVPATAFIFLSKYPERRKFTGKFIYFALWIIAYESIEGIWHYFDKIKYYHGWTIGWSLFFYCIMFPLIRIHFKRPLIALFFTALVALFFILKFNIPIIDMGSNQ